MRHPNHVTQLVENRTTLHLYDVLGLAPKGGRLRQWIARKAWRWLEKGKHLAREPVEIISVEHVPVSEKPIIEAIRRAIDNAYGYRIPDEQLVVLMGPDVWQEAKLTAPRGCFSFDTGDLLRVRDRSYNDHPDAPFVRHPDRILDVEVRVAPWVKGWVVVPPR